MTGTDLDLERRVVNYLWGRHVPSLRRLSVDADNGVVTVRGRVRSFYEKQLCQNCCRRVAGVVQLIDEVEVAGAPEIHLFDSPVPAGLGQPELAEAVA